MKFLKASIPHAEKLNSLKPQIDKLYEQKKGYKDEYVKHKLDVESKEKEIESVRKEIGEAKEQRADLKEQLDKYQEEIDKVKEDLQKLYDQKNEAKEEYYKNKLEWEIEKDEIYHNEWIAKKKQELIDREARKKEIIEERKQKLLDRPNPFEREIDTCEHLIGWCKMQKIKAGLDNE